MWKKKNAVLHIRIDDDTKNALKEKAAASGRKLSAYLYDILKTIADAGNTPQGNEGNKR